MKHKTTLKNNLIGLIDQTHPSANRRKYNFGKSKAEEIYGNAKKLLLALPKDTFTKRMLKQAMDQLNAISQTWNSYAAL